MMRKYFIILIALYLTLNSCIPVKYAGKKHSPKSYFVEFYVDKNINQYFIKPIEYKNNNNNILTIDFTFRDSAQKNSPIIANYSIFSKEVIKKVDSAYYLVNDFRIRLFNQDRLFIDHKKKYEIRYSNNLTYQNLIDILANHNSQIVVYYENSEHVFSPTKKTQNAIDICKTNIIDIIELNKEY